MKKILLILLMAFIGLSSAFAQVGIGTTSPAPGSILDLTSTDRALLITRVANTAAIATPEEGMMIFDLSSKCFKGYQDGAWTDCGFINVQQSNAVLTQIGNEADSPNTVPSVVTATQLASISGVTGVVPANEAAYQAYIDANPNNFASPATVAEVQAMITAVNNSQSVLAQIGNEGDSPNTVPSVVTATQLGSISGVTGVVPANEAAYQAYIDANPNNFASPATVAEVNAMITAVNASQSVLAQIGNEGDSPNTVPSVVTATQLASISGVTGVVPANEAAYQAYIDANPNNFASPATVAEVQAMITAVNNSQSVLAQIGNEADSPNTVPSVVTTTQLASISGVTGVVPANEAAYQAYIDANPNNFASPATVAEVQAMINAVNASQSVLAQIGNEGDSPNTVPSVVTVAQINTISPAITGALLANEAAYQAYIDANPALFSAPATVAEVQAMITAVNNSQSVLAQIGNEGDSPNTVPSVVTVAQINTISPAITGALLANQAAYQAYIDANPSLFDAPATQAQVQAMITAVNNSQSALAQIGNEGDSPNTVPSVVTTTQLASISGVTGVVPGNEAAYQAYIDANPNNFASPATVAEVNAMISAVNASQSVLAQIGNEGDSPNTVPSVVTATQLASISGVTGVVPGNEAAYQAYIDANPNNFASPATVAEVQAMITAVNNSQSVLAQIGNEGDSPNTVPSVVTTTQLASISGVTGVVPANEAAYQAYIDANPNNFASPATVAEVQAMITAVNNSQSVLAQIGNEGDSPNTVPSVVTVAQINTISPAITGALLANQAAYQAYIDANPSLFASPATVAEVQAMINAVNASQSVLAQIGNEGDSPNTVPSVVTTTQLASISGVTGVVPGNEAAYQAYIDANPNNFASPATVAEVQAMITAVNNSQSVLAQIGNEADSPNTVPSVVTATQLASISGVTGVVPANQTAYQAYIDANPNNFASPATVAEVQAMITAVNNSQSVLAQIGNEGDSPNTVPSVVTTTQLASISGVTGVVPGNEAAYQAYIDANPNNFASPATVAEVNAMISAVNASQSVLAQIGNEGDSPNTVPSVVTATQLASISGVTGVVPANEAAYQAYIDANPNNFASPATVAEVQAMITAVNNSQSVLAQIGNEGDSPNTVPSVVTTTQLASISGVTGVVPANEAAYQAYIDANPNNFASPATVAEVQAMITAVNNSQSVLAQIGNEGDSPNTVPSVVTVAQINTISPAITGALLANEAAYQAYIDANPALFSAPATVAEVQAMVTAVNNSQSVLAQIGNEADSPNTVPSVVTTTQLASISGVTGVVPANQTAYQAYIDANPNNFASPATVAEVQAMITAVNNSQSVLAQIGNEGDSPNTVPSVVTVAQINTISPAITGALLANQAAYQAYIDANPSLFDAPATQAQVQAMINAVNNLVTSGGTALVSAYVCNTASAGTMTAGTPVSGVTQTITATVTTVGTYSISTTANGVTFAGSGTFAGTGAQNIVLTATGTPAAAGTNTFTLNTTPNCSFNRNTNSPSTNGTGVVSAYDCNTASAGNMIVGTPVSGVTQTITATVTTVGTYSIAATANGVTFVASGTFAGTGAQNIVLNATGTPTAAGSNTFTLNTTPNCNFNRVTICGAFVAAGVFKAFQCYNLGAYATTEDPNIPVRAIHGSYYQWGRNAPAATVTATTDALVGAWGSQGGTSANGNWTSTAGGGPGNPCPTGFRVPSKPEWDGVINASLNTVSRTGSWANNGNFTTAIHYGPSVSNKTLTLPAAGYRDHTNGTLNNRGSNGAYWSSTDSSTNAWYMYFSTGNAFTSSLGPLPAGYSVRCVSE